MASRKGTPRDAGRLGSQRVSAGWLKMCLVHRNCILQACCGSGLNRLRLRCGAAGRSCSWAGTCGGRPIAEPKVEPIFLVLPAVSSRSTRRTNSLTCCRCVWELRSRAQMVVLAGVASSCSTTSGFLGSAAPAYGPRSPWLQGLGGAPLPWLGVQGREPWLLLVRLLEHEPPLLLLEPDWRLPLPGLARPGSGCCRPVYLGSRGGRSRRSRTCSRRSLIAGAACAAGLAARLD